MLFLIVPLLVVVLLLIARSVLRAIMRIGLIILAVVAGAIIAGLLLAPLAGTDPVLAMVGGGVVGGLCAIGRLKRRREPDWAGPVVRDRAPMVGIPDPQRRAGAEPPPAVFERAHPDRDLLDPVLARRLAAVTNRIRQAHEADPLDLALSNWASTLDHAPELIAATRACLVHAPSERTDAVETLRRQLTAMIDEGERLLSGVGDEHRTRLETLRRYVDERLREAGRG